MKDIIKYILVILILSTDYMKEKMIMNLKMEKRNWIVEDVAPNHVRFKIITWWKVWQRSFISNWWFHGSKWRCQVWKRIQENLDLVGTGGSDLPDLKAEFSETPHLRGTISAARSSDPNSANSQFLFVSNLPLILTDSTQFLEK